MANQAANPVSAERSAHLLLMGAVSGIFLMAGTVTKNERAVFLTDGGGIPIKAFAAMVPPEQARRSERSARPGRNFALLPLSDAVAGSGSPRRLAAPINDLVVPDSTVTAPVAPLVPPGVSPAGTSPGPDQSQLASLGPSPVQFAPTVPQPGAGGGGTTGSSPGGGGSTPGNPTTPVNPTTPGNPSTPNPTPTPPVSAVPEPATWGMLLMGFFAIGVALRRKALPVRSDAMRRDKAA